MKTTIDINKRPLVIIAGPTAVGKTATSVQLAKRLGGEIVSADSVQVYRGLDIGSAKVTKEEMEGVPHHLIDVIDPETNYDVNRFKNMAEEAIEKIYERGHLPILVGGTGFYIQALLYGIDFTEENEEMHRAVRSRLEKEAETMEGREGLYRQLKEIDPESAMRIHPNNIPRVIRAIEFYELHKTPISLHNAEEKQKTARFQTAFFVLTDDRQRLYERINKRVDGMMDSGLLEEAKWLKALQLPEDATSMKGIGYREMLAYLDNRCTIEDAVEAIKKNSRNYAKRQLTWFRREQNVEWVNIAEFNYKKETITEWITEKCLKLLA